MRTDAEVQEEVAALKTALDGFWNNDSKELIRAEIRVLENRMTGFEVDAAFIPDETSEEYEENDQEVYHAACVAQSWLSGSEPETPSKKWQKTYEATGDQALS